MDPQPSQLNRIPSCRFCHAGPSLQSIKGHVVYGGSNDQHFWRCQACQMIYLYPAMSEDEELAFYTSEFEKYMACRSGADTDWSGPERHFLANQREVARRMPFLEPHLDGRRTVLEVGCSSGFMLSALKARGMSVVGIDPSGVFVDYVTARGIPVFKRIEDFDSCPLDLIIHYYVLEHVRRPVEFIRQYMTLLSAGGTMVFEVPCASEPLIELYKVPAFERFYWSVAHHWYFTKESLASVLEAVGYEFELFPEQRYDISNHMTWMLEGRPGGLGRYSATLGEEVDRRYKDRLKELWCCDTLVAVVQKR